LGSFCRTPCDGVALRGWLRFLKSPFLERGGTPRNTAEHCGTPWNLHLIPRQQSAAARDPAHRLCPRVAAWAIPSVHPHPPTAISHPRPSFILLPSSLPKVPPFLQNKPPKLIISRACFTVFRGGAILLDSVACRRAPQPWPTDLYYTKQYLPGQVENHMVPRMVTQQSLARGTDSGYRPILWAGPVERPGAGDGLPWLRTLSAVRPVHGLCTAGFGP
jgi:hypothetical protein